MKYCNDCSTNKSLSEFSRNARKPDGVDIYCKCCTSKRSRAHYQANKAKRKEQNIAWLVANPKASASYSKSWRLRNPGAQDVCDKAWYEKNRAKKLASDKSKRELNLEKYLQRERASYSRNRASSLRKNAIWRANNPAKITAYAAARRASVRRATPPWTTDTQAEEILSFYVEAARLKDETGKCHHVDHIVPLRGKTVCGLNVPWNLQVLTDIENLKKSNSFK